MQRSLETKCANMQTWSDKKKHHNTFHELHHYTCCICAEMCTLVYVGGTKATYIYKSPKKLQHAHKLWIMQLKHIMQRPRINLEGHGFTLWNTWLNCNELLQTHNIVDHCEITHAVRDTGLSAQVPHQDPPFPCIRCRIMHFIHYALYMCTEFVQFWTIKCRLCAIKKGQT